MDKMKVLAALQANKSDRTGARLSATKVYTVHAGGDVTAKLPPQAIKLIEIMFTQDVESWTEVALHELIEGHTEISEKQAPWTIFKFYRQLLVDAKFLTVK